MSHPAGQDPAALLALIGRVLPLQVQGRGTSEQIVVEIVHRRYPDRDKPKLVEHVDQPAFAASAAHGSPAVQWRPAMTF